jgi:hypothetical protein
MKKILLLSFIFGLSTMFILTITSCQKELEFGQGNVKVHIEQGDEWKHKFNVFVKNDPQIAVWIEDTAGNYLSTIYVTKRIATQSWRGASERKEALPHWSYLHGTVLDGVSGATPKGSFDVKLAPADTLKHFVVKVEINHSTDYNSSYPENAKEGDVNYSASSGQPALIYSAKIDLISGIKSFDAAIIGHSSPDGSNGEIYQDLSGFTTALKIVKGITVSLQ